MTSKTMMSPWHCCHLRGVSRVTMPGVTHSSYHNSQEWMGLEMCSRLEPKVCFFFILFNPTNKFRYRLYITQPLQPQPPDDNLAHKDPQNTSHCYSGPSQGKHFWNEDLTTTTTTFTTTLTMTTTTTTRRRYAIRDAYAS